MKGIYHKIIETENSDNQAALCIVTQTKGSTPRKAGSKMLVFENKNIVGTIGGGSLENEVIENAIEVIKSRKPQIVKLKLEQDLNMSCGGYVEVFIEPIVNKMKLFIFGAGHIGRIVAQMAYNADFRVFLIDERIEIFNEFENQNYTLIKKNHNLAFSELKFDSSAFICSISHKHGYDKEIVEYCANQTFAYLGMIGSKRKIAKISSEFLEKNTVSQELINKIDWPMGVQINCETPYEIAISIVAKLIDERGKITKITEDNTKHEE